MNLKHLTTVANGDTTTITAELEFTDFDQSMRYMYVLTQFVLAEKKIDALNQPEAEENNGRFSTRLEAAEGQQGVEDTKESCEGVQSRRREEGEA